jgi:hypothetical protein
VSDGARAPSPRRSGRPLSSSSAIVDRPLPPAQGNYRVGFRPNAPCIGLPLVTRWCQHPRPSLAWGWSGARADPICAKTADLRNQRKFLNLELLDRSHTLDRTAFRQARDHFQRLRKHATPRHAERYRRIKAFDGPKNRAAILKFPYPTAISGINSPVFLKMKMTEIFIGIGSDHLPSFSPRPKRLACFLGRLPLLASIASPLVRPPVRQVGQPRAAPSCNRPPCFAPASAASPPHRLVPIAAPRSDRSFARSIGGAQSQ